MQKETIITLDDNTKYALLDETTLDGVKYFYAIKVDYETENPTTEYEIFEEEIEGKDVYMTVLEESEKKQLILLEFTNKYMSKINNMIDDKED